jgi:hypothetical protein
MKWLSSIARFSGCTKSDATITEVRGIIAEDLTATAGMLSAVPPADRDRALSVTMKDARGQDRTTVVTTAVGPMVLDMNGVGPAVLRPIVMPRKVAPAIDRIQMVLRNAPASTTSRKTQRATLPSSRARQSRRRKPPL